jgi:guanylate kinase
MKKSRTQIPSMVIKGENVIGNITASGRSQLKIEQKVIHQATPEIEKLFKRVNRKLPSRPANVQEQVKKIEKEAAKGEKADPAKLEGSLVKLARMAPDILDVILASLGGPVTGFTAVFKKIADRAKATSTG